MGILNILGKKLPKGDLPIEGGSLHISQGDNHQVVFMEFEKDVDVQEHKHSDQVEFVVKGKVDIFLENVKKTYVQGDQFFIPANTLHSAKVYAGYAAIAYFDEKDRYSITKNSF